MMNHLLQSLVWVMTDLAFPRHCQVCLGVMPHENRTYLCEACGSSIRSIRDSACQGCAKDYPGLERLICPNCLRQKHFYESCYAVSIYEGSLRDLLQSFKFSRAEYLAFTLQRIFLEGAKRLDWEKIDLIVPVPLHRRKLKERGFNQSLVLAQALAASHGRKLLSRELIRTKYSQGQTLQDKKARLENIRGSFKVRRTEKIKDKRVLLVDDVLTTGATIQECARVLKEAGAKSVIVLVLARSI